MLWVIGDSWSDPTFAQLGVNGWPQLVAARLGLGLLNAAQGGAGFLQWNPASWNYPLEVVRYPCPTAAVAVSLGSVNDQPHDPVEVRAAAATTFAMIRRVAPDAELLVIGPQYWADPIPARMYPLADAVSAAAAGAGAPFVDALQWMQGRPELLGADQHPTVAGQLYLADLLTPLIAQLAAGPGPDTATGAAFDAAFPLTFGG